jgi:hypothetical protein
MWFSCALFLVIRFSVSRQQKWTFSFVAERPRSPMATRGAIHAGRGTSPSMERDAGSHSVDRIVGLFSFGLPNWSQTAPSFPKSPADFFPAPDFSPNP